MRTIISTINLGKQYRKEISTSKIGDKFWALRHLNISIQAGQKVGVIGGNGAGKSTFLKLLSQITSPTEGKAIIDGRVGSLLEVGTGFHPELSGKDNIYLNGAVLGMSYREIKMVYKQIVDFTEIGDRIDSPVKHYSSGMYMRLGFAVAAHLPTEILLIDEVLSLGDIRFQQKCLDRMGRISREGRTILFVSHNLTSIRQFCSRAILLDRGRMIADGPVDTVLQKYVNDNGPTNGSFWTNKDIAEIGDEVAYIKSVKIVDANGQEKTYFLNSEDVVVNMCVVIKEMDNSLKFGFDLFFQGLLAFRSHQIDSLTPPALKRGENKLTALIPKYYLNKGVYAIRPIISLHNKRTLRQLVSPVVNFTVELDSQNNPFHSVLNQEIQPGPVFPLLSWVINK